MSKYNKAIAAAVANVVMVVLASVMGPAVLENPELSGAVVTVVNAVVVWAVPNKTV